MKAKVLSPGFESLKHLKLSPNSTSAQSLGPSASEPSVANELVGTMKSASAIAATSVRVVLSDMTFSFVCWPVCTSVDGCTAVRSFRTQFQHSI